MKIIDLSLQIHDDMFVYPWDPKVDIEQLQTIEKNNRNMKRLHINSHDGTHVNTPIHCDENGKYLDEYNIEDFCGESILYNKESKIKTWLWIIFKEQISIKIAEEIIKIKPKFVGLTMEVDEDIEILLLKNNILLFERLTNTDKLPSEFYFYGIPLNIKNGDGSPIRAFAVLK